MAGVRKLRSGTWQGWYQHYEGRRAYFTLTRTAARREVLTAAQSLAVEHAKIREGVLPRPDQHRVALARPIREVIEEYQAWGALQGGRGKRPWTPRHQMNVARQLAWWCQQLQLQILGDTLGILPRVESGLRQLAGQDRSPNTLNRYLAALHGFVAWCRERDYLHEDPLQHLTWLPTTPRVRRRAMTLEEMQRLLEVCHPERGLVYQTALMTGLRANELRQLSLEHLDVERCGLRLDADWTKNRQPEFQLLPQALVGALEASARSGEPQRCYARHYARAAGTLRISYPDIPLLFVPRHTETMLYGDLHRAGIPRQTAAGKLDFHALRTAYINLVWDHGATPPEALHLARHRTPALTISPDYGYARTRETRLQELVEGIAQQILGKPHRAHSVHAHVAEEEIPLYSHAILPGAQQIIYLSQQDITTPTPAARTPQMARSGPQTPARARDDSAAMPQDDHAMPRALRAQGVHADPDLAAVVAA